MAYIDDERRRTASLRLTRQQEDWMARAMDAQSKGLPIPPKPTETGDDGMQRLTPAYTDPRSQAIAQTPAMIRPAHSMLDRLFRPGRADAANQMNREYKENALTGQIASQSAGADAALKELELRARSGKDPEALKGLEKYYKVEALRRGGSGNNMQDFINMSKGDGSIPDGPMGSAKPKGAAGDTPASLPADVTRRDLTPTQNRIRAQQRVAEINELIEQQQQIVDRKPRKVRRQASGRDWKPNRPEYVDMPFESSYSEDDIKNAPLKLEALQQEKKKLEQVLSKISGPLTGPDMGSANVGTIDR